MKYTVATFLGLAAIASAQLAPRYTPAPGTDECTVQYDSCRYAYEANQATCAANYADCLGYNPFTTTVSTATSTWPTPVADPTYPAITPPATVDCGATFTACLKSNGTEDATCAAQFAACQGENPYSATNTTTSTPGVPAVTGSANPWINSTLTTIAGSTKTGTGSGSTTTGGSKNGTTTGTAPKGSTSVFEGGATANTVGAVSLMAFFVAAALLL